MGKKGNLDNTDQQVISSNVGIVVMIKIGEVFARTNKALWKLGKINGKEVFRYGYWFASVKMGEQLENFIRRRNSEN